MSLSAWVMEVKARSPDTASIARISQSDQQILTMSGERIREPDCNWEKTMEMKSPEMADQLTKTGVETPCNDKTLIFMNQEY